jgi:hypothetical protein
VLVIKDITKLLVDKNYELKEKRDVITGKLRYFEFVGYATQIDTWEDNKIEPYCAHTSEYDYELI